MLEIPIDYIINYISDHKIENLGAILTVICVWYNTKANVWGWIIGIASISCYIYVFFDAMLYSDYLLNIYFLLMSLYGWYNWQFGDKNKSELPISRASKKEIFGILTGGIIGTISLGTFFSMNFPEASVPYWDACTTSFSVLAQWQLARKKLENWIIWIFVNMLCIGIYYHKTLITSSILYFILLIIAVKGYQDWRKMIENQSSVKT